MIGLGLLTHTAITGHRGKQTTNMLLIDLLNPEIIQVNTTAPTPPPLPGKIRLPMFEFLLVIKDRLTTGRLAFLADASYSKRFRKWEPFYNSFLAQEFCIVYLPFPITSSYRNLSSSSPVPSCFVLSTVMFFSNQSCPIIIVFPLPYTKESGFYFISQIS